MSATSIDTPDSATAPVEIAINTGLSREHLLCAAREDLEPNFRRYLRFLGYRDGNPLELQVLDAKSPIAPVHGQGFAFVRSVDAAVRLVRLADDGFNSTGTFVIPNAIDPRIIARASADEWHQQIKGAGTKDHDISARRAFFVDCDAERPAGISATQPERDLAFRRAVEIHRELARLLGSDGALGLGMSGNGGHAHVALADLPNSDEVARLIAEILGAFDARYSDDAVKIDTTVSDAKRLSPAFGTMKRKGENGEERRHRRTFFACHEDVQRLSLDQLRQLHDGLVPAVSNGAKSTGATKSSSRARASMPSAAPGGDSALTRLNEVPVREVAARLGIDSESPTCPGCGAANAGSDVAFLEEGNGLKCLHATCGARFWTPVDLVAKVAFEVDQIKGSRGVVARVVEWFARELNVVTLDGGRRLRAVAAVPDSGAADLDERPQIIVSSEQEVVNDAAIVALAAHDPCIYERGMRLVRVLKDDATAASQIALLAEPTLREKLASSARWLAVTKDGLSPAHPPLWSVKAVFERRSWPGVRPLRGIIETPVLRPDGTVLSTPGYDAATGLLYLPGFDFGVIAENPTRDDALAASAELLDVVCDFPFELPAHKAAWLSSTLTLFAMHAINGPAPMFIVDGNMRGAGKGLLCDADGVIATGKPFSKMAHVTKDEELEKRITSLAIAGTTSCLVDNLRGFFGGAVWEAVLTTRHWRGRVLGKSETVDVPLDVVWFATGNNVEVGGDMGRRVVHIRLLSPEERPEERTGFKHPDLLGWVKQERPRLVRAALTILRAYFVAGCPEQPGVRLGSFEGWARTVASAVVWLGLEDPCKTREGIEAAAGSDETRLGALLDAWTKSFNETAHSAAEVLRVIEAEDRRRAKPAYSGDPDDFMPHEYQQLRDVLVELFGRDGRLPSARSLGSRLGHFRQRNAGGRCFVADIDGHDKTARWRVADVAAPELRVLAGSFLERSEAAALKAETHTHPCDADQVADKDLRVLRYLAGSSVLEKNPQETTCDSNALERLRYLAGSLSSSSTCEDLSSESRSRTVHGDHGAQVIDWGSKQTPQNPQEPAATKNPHALLEKNPQPNPADYADVRRWYARWTFAADGIYADSRVSQRDGFCFADTPAGLAVGPGKFGPRQDSDIATVKVLNGEIVEVVYAPEVPLSTEEVALYQRVLDKSVPHCVNGLYDAYLQVRTVAAGQRYLRAQHPYLLTTAWCVAPDLPDGAYVGNIECRLRDLPDGRTLSVITACEVHGVGTVV